MKTLILSRLALFGMLFTILVFTQFKKPDKISPSFNAITQVEANNSNQAVNADNFDAESPATISYAVFPRTNKFLPTRRNLYSGNEQNLIYRQSLFNVPLFKPKPDNETYPLLLTANRQMNKSSPLRR